ncbi:chromosome partitioning protein [Singulisphaera sp. GP187]|uniref:ParA family protein n=1 Tax=Singulisphaera sp. GP187 TaxID=1882752 RepID=UPI000925B3E8|nr:ParA family protein [Singulisphaera sp. GP187]SIN70226.1 chromosome partitioning protein [Singulisphaera sp. GP187]
MSAQIIAFVNAKGGVGRTTLVIHCAGYLAAAGLRPLVVDNDSRCNLTQIMVTKDDLRTIKRSDIGLVYERRPGPPPGRIVRKTRFNNLFLIPATPNLSTHDHRGSLLGEYPNQGLRKFLQHVKPQFDLILIDCTAWNGPLTEAALVAADAVIIPVQAGVVGTMGLQETLEFVEVVRSRFNPGLRLCGIVVTMRDARSKEMPKHEAQLRSAHGDAVFPAAIPSLSAFAKEPIVGRNGRLKFDTNILRDPRPEMEVFTNEVLSRMGSPKRIFGGKASTITDDAADGGPSGTTEALSIEKPLLGEDDFDSNAGCWQLG